MKIFKLILVILLFIRIATFNNSLPEGKTILISGRILNEVIQKENSQQIEINSHKIFIDKYPTVYYGDWVSIEGEVINGEIKKAAIKNRSEAIGLFKIRNYLINSVASTLPIDDAALVTGIVFGAKELISKETWQKFINVGVAHVVVASGTNVVLTASFLINLFVLFLNRKKAIAISILGIWLYVVLSGFDAPLIRAAIMGTIAFSAQAFGRLSHTLSALIYSVIFMILIKPVWLTDIGFQLSLMATLSLILFETYVNRLLSFVPKILKGDLSTSLTAQIGVGPLLLFHFGQINLLSPIVNMLILWTVAPIMVIGALGSVFSPVLYLLIPFTKFFLGIVAMFDSLK